MKVRFVAGKKITRSGNVELVRQAGGKLPVFDVGRQFVLAQFRRQPVETRRDRRCARRRGRRGNGRQVTAATAGDRAPTT